ncbi:hypothetical protein MUP29_07835 [bacterium]|nr:hypothetical protein [bacterium]
MPEELDALITKLGPFNDPGGGFGVIEGESRPEAVLVVGVAIYGKEADQFVRVLLDLDGV